MLVYAGRNRPFVPRLPSPLTPLPIYIGRGELLVVVIVEVKIIVVAHQSTTACFATMDATAIARSSTTSFIVSRNRMDKVMIGVDVMVVVSATSCTLMLRGTTLLMIVMNKYVQCKQTTRREVPLSRSDAGEGLGVRAIGDKGVVE